MNPPAIAGLILAGGASRRMGSPKALLKIHGATFLDRLIGLFVEACSPVIVVLGHDAGRIRASLVRADEVSFAINPDPERGMLSSLQCGLAEIPAGVEALIFTPVDYPNIQSGTIEKLARSFTDNAALVTIPQYQGRHGHPVCITRPVMDELIALPPTRQARDVIRVYRDRTRFLEVGDPGILSDVDVPEDYRSLQAQLAR